MVEESMSVDQALLDAQLSELPFELASLSKAQNYQGWVFRTVQPFLGKRILEIGAGIGNMSKWMPLRERLILTEIDPELLKILQGSVVSAGQSADPRVTVKSLDISGPEFESLRAENLDTVISFNVLEHIQDDEGALRRLCDLIRSSKASGARRLITFVPAHQWAFGSMDRTFGHFRRYSRRQLLALCKKVAPEAKVHSRHLNLVGLAGWIWNGRVLKKPTIGLGSIAAFEMLCPFLSPLDDVLHKVFKIPLGQSLLVVLEWESV